MSNIESNSNRLWLIFAGFFMVFTMMILVVGAGDKNDTMTYFLYTVLFSMMLSLFVAISISRRRIIGSFLSLKPFVENKEIK